MSNSVVPAAAVAHAKQLVRNKKLVKRTDEQKPARDEQSAADNDQDAANTTHVIQADRADHLPTSMSDTTLSGDFSFAGALSAAASESASLTTTLQSDSGGSTGDDGDGAGGTVLLVGAVGLVGLGVAVLAGGGGGNSNDPPAFSADSKAVTTNEDTAAAVTVTATDPDNDPLSYSVTTAPTKGTVTGGANGAFTYTPNANYNGADSFVVTVNDGQGGTDTIKVDVTVTAVNDAPVANAATTKTLSIDEDTKGTIVMDFTDPEGDAITLALKTGPANGTLDGKTLVYTPNANYNGSDKVVFTVTDAKGASVDQTVDITVKAVNDAPTTAASQSVSVIAGSAANGTVTATDVDAGDTLTYSVKTGADQADNGTVTIGASDGKFTYTPNAGYTGADNFVVTVTDKAGATASQTVNIQVGPAIVTQSIDVVGPNSTTPASINAGSDKFKFTDDATKDTDVLITNFTNNDSIVVTGATSAQYNFSTGTDPNDLAISYQASNGAVNLILIDNVLNSSVFVLDYASAVQAVGFSFMTFA